MTSFLKFKTIATGATGAILLSAFWITSMVAKSGYFVSSLICRTNPLTIPDCVVDYVSNASLHGTLEKPIRDVTEFAFNRLIFSTYQKYGILTVRAFHSPSPSFQ